MTYEKNQGEKHFYEEKSFGQQQKTNNEWQKNFVDNDSQTKRKVENPEADNHYGVVPTGTFSANKDMF